MRDTLLDCSLGQTPMTIFPVLAEPSNGFAETYRERCDRFEALLAPVG
jgi:hypothetical protein